MKPVCRQCIAHNICFKIGNKTVRGMLKLTAPTGFKMHTRRGNPMIGWRDYADLTQHVPIQFSGYPFTRQGHGNKDRSRGDAIALVAHS